MKAFYNTKKQGVLQFLVFKEKEDFVGVCLNLNIIEYGNNPEKLMKSIVEAAQSLIEGVKSKKLPDDCLNQPAPLKYWKIAERCSEKDNGKTDPSFLQITRTKYPLQNCYN